MTDPLLLDIPDRIDTPRLLMRPPVAGDGWSMHQAIVESLPELRRFLAALPWVAQAQSAQSAEAHCRKSQANFLARSDLPFLLIEKASGQLVGVVGLHRPVWAVPKAEVGYWVRASRARQGLVGEAVEALVSFAFDALRMARIELVTDAENAASRRVAERCGFTLEGTLRDDRRDADGVLRSTCLYARFPERAAGRSLDGFAERSADGSAGCSLDGCAERPLDGSAGRSPHLYTARSADKSVPAAPAAPILPGPPA